MPEELNEQQKAELALAQHNQQAANAPRDLQELIDKSDAPIIPKPDVEKKEKEKAKPLTPEEISQATDALGDRLGFSRKDKKKEEKVEEKPAAETKTDEEKAAEADAAAAAEKAKADKKKVKVTRKEPAPDVSDLAAITAAKTARAVAEELRQQAPRVEKIDPLAEVESSLIPDEQSELLVYKQMAQDNPAYKDLPRQYLTFIQRTEAYKTKWERDNPGEDFNPDDETHDQFYKANTPAFSPRDFHKAEVRMEARQYIREENERKAPERAEAAKETLLPVIQQTKLAAAVKIVETLDPTMLATIEKDGFEKFAEEDPVAADALKMSAAKLSNFLEAAHQFDDPNGRIPYNPDDPGHREYSAYLLKKEAEFARKPMKDRYDDEGRLFLNRHDYIQIAPAKRGDYWYLDAPKLIELRVTEQADEAKKYVDSENKKLEKLAKARGWQTNGEIKEKPKKADETPAKAAATTTDIKSPEAGGGGKIDTAASAGQNNGNSFFDKSADILFRR